MIRRLVWSAVAAAVAFGIVTWWALESSEVVILRTRARDGGITETRVWVADGDGHAWIEAATPERGWYRELEAHPSVELVRDGTTIAYEATGLPGPEGHARIRGMLRAKSSMDGPTRGSGYCRIRRARSRCGWRRRA